MKAELRYRLQRVKNVWHWVRSVFWVNYYGWPGKHLTIIGVTGTDGKTTTTTLIYEILKAAGYRVDYLSTVNSKGLHTTNPDAADLQPWLKKRVEEGITHIVLEVTAHGLDQNRVWGCPFFVGVFTNLSHEHLDDFVDMDRYRRTKYKLFKNVEYAVLNADDPTANEYEKWLKADKPKRLKAVVRYGPSKLERLGTGLEGKYNRYNVGAAEAVAEIFGVHRDKIEKAVAGFAGVPGRREEVKAGQKFRVVVDFAHTPKALEEVLKSLRAEKAAKSRLVVVFGATGGRDQTKRPVMGKVAADLAEVVIVTSDDTRMEPQEQIYGHIISGIQESKLNQVIREDDRRKAIEKAIELARPGDVVLLAGKGHETSLLHGRVEQKWSDVQVARDVITSSLR